MTKHSLFLALDHDYTPLLLAALEGHVEVMRMLLNAFCSSLDEVNNVSMYTLACSTTYMTRAFQ